MNKEQAIEQVENRLKELTTKTWDYIKSNDNMDNYAMIPPESNYMHASAYVSDTYATEEEKQKFIDILVRQFNFHDKEELLHDLWNNCEVVGNWNQGYYFNPADKIVFDYIRIEEEEIQLDDPIVKLIEQFNIDTDSLDTDLIIDGNLACLYICGGISFELDIKTAMEYLKNRE